MGCIPRKRGPRGPRPGPPPSQRRRQTIPAGGKGLLIVKGGQLSRRSLEQLGELFKEDCPHNLAVIQPPPGAEVEYIPLAPAPEPPQPAQRRSLDRRSDEYQPRQLSSDRRSTVRGFFLVMLGLLSAVAAAVTIWQAMKP